jgi:hypothetical protein
MNICTAFITHAQPPVWRQPRQGPLDDPSVDAQPPAVGRPPFGHHRRHAPRPPLLAVWLRIIAPVALHPVRPAPRTPGLAADRWNRLKQWQQLGNIMAVGFCYQGGQGHPVGIGTR